MIMNKLTLMQTLVPVLVPAAIAALKLCLPKIPKAWLPILAPLLGALIDIAATCQVGPGTPLAALLGAAGVGLREILDQLRKSLGAAPPPPPPSPAPAGQVLGLLLLCSLPVLLPGCQTPDTTAYKTAAGLETAVDRALRSWADYVVWKRQQAAGGGGPGPARGPGADGPRGLLGLSHRHEHRLRSPPGRGPIGSPRQSPATAGKANAPWQDALAAAQAASVRLVELVDLFLRQPAAPAP